MRTMYFLAGAFAALACLSGPTGIGKPARAATIHASLPFCRWADLNGNVVWAKTIAGQQGAGSIKGRVAYTQHGGTACELQGWVRARILDADGRPLAVTYRQVIGRGAAKALPVHRPGYGSVVSNLTWANWCQGVVKGTSISLQVTLPHSGGTRTLPVDQVGFSGVMTPDCTNRKAGSTLSVNRFTKGP